MSAALDSVPATQSSAKEVNVAAWVDEEVRFCGEKRAVGEKGNGSPQELRLSLPSDQGEEHILFPFQTIVWFLIMHTSIMKEEDVYVNRVECDTAIDFNRVSRLLISTPIECPVKNGYNYVFVLSDD